MLCALLLLYHLHGMRPGLHLVVKIVRSGITRREFGISPGHNGIAEKNKATTLNDPT